MQNYDFDFQFDDFMLCCRTRQLRPKTMASYEQTLRLFQRWLKQELNVEKVNEVKLHFAKKQKFPKQILFASIMGDYVDLG